MKESQIIWKMNQISMSQKELAKSLLEMQGVLKNIVLRVFHLESKLNIGEEQINEFEKEFISKYKEHPQNPVASPVQSERAGKPERARKDSRQELSGDESDGVHPGMSGNSGSDDAA
jgi:hypothetical protein